MSGIPLGNLEEAESLYVDALEAQRRVLGDSHPHALISMHNLARVCVVGQRHEEAEATATKCLELTEKARGPDHPNTLRAVGLLVGLYEAWEQAGPGGGTASRLRW